MRNRLIIRIVPWYSLFNRSLSLNWIQLSLSGLVKLPTGQHPNESLIWMHQSIWHPNYITKPVVLKRLVIWYVGQWVAVTNHYFWASITLNCWFKLINKASMYDAPEKLLLYYCDFYAKPKQSNGNNWVSMVHELPE